MKRFAASQGGSVEVIDDPNKLPQARYQIEILSATNGYVHEIHAVKSAFSISEIRTQKPELIRKIIT